MKLKVKVLNLSQGPNQLPLPNYATEGDDAVDLKACFNMTTNKDQSTYWSILRVYDPYNSFHDIPAYVNEEFTLKPGHRVLVPTGLKVGLPIGWELQIKSRSGLALKSGIIVLNSPGTVDAPYRGVVGVILYNTTKDDFKFKHGDRIAQMALKQSNEIDWNEVDTDDQLGATERGDGGFGHTGFNGNDIPETPDVPEVKIEPGEVIIPNGDPSVVLYGLSGTVGDSQNKFNDSDIETRSNS